MRVWERLAASPKGKRPLGEAKPPKKSRPYNGVKQLVIEVLKDQPQPLQPAEIQRLLRAATGEDVPRSSIKYSLWSGSRRVNGAFVREPDGYRLKKT